MSEERRQQLAEFRFEVIAPLLDERIDGAEKTRLRKEILATTFTTPDGKTWQISARTLRNWLKRYKRTRKIDELKNCRSKTLGLMKALDEKVLEEAVELREKMRDRSIPDILMHLKFTSNTDVSKIAASTLNRQLNRVGATKEKNHAERGGFQPFEKEHINQTWQSDCSDGIYLPDPLGLKEVRQTVLITCFDDASRFCVFGQFYWTEQLLDLLDCFRNALTARGLPSCLYTDNGPIYRAKNLKSICADLGIKLKHAEAYKPQGKGKQERHYLTIQMRFYKEARKAGIQTLQELNEFFWAWLDECYHKEKHRSLKTTPLERWQREEGTIKRISSEELQRCMQLREYRKVDTKTAQIRLDGKRYQASQNLSGQRVQVRWPFDDDSALNIWRDGHFVEQAKLYVLPSDIDYSKRPQRALNGEESKVLDCSKQLRLNMVAKYRGEQPQRDTSRCGVLTENEFVHVIEQCLGKSMDQTEIDLLLKSYKQLYPVDAELVEQCLKKVQANYGNRMYVGFYMERLAETKTTKTNKR